MINNYKQILVAFNCKNLSIKWDAFNLVPCKIKNLNLVLIGNGSPCSTQCNADNIIPWFIPWTVITFESKCCLICIDKIAPIHREKFIIFSIEKGFSFVLIMKILLNFGLLILCVFIYTTVKVYVQETMITEGSRSSWERQLRIGCDDFISFCFFRCNILYFYFVFFLWLYLILGFIEFYLTFFFYVHSVRLGWWDRPIVFVDPSISSDSKKCFSS